MLVDGSELSEALTEVGNGKIIVIVEKLTAHEEVSVSDLNLYMNYMMTVIFWEDKPKRPLAIKVLALRDIDIITSDPDNMLTTTNFKTTRRYLFKNIFLTKSLPLLKVRISAFISTSLMIIHYTDLS